MLRTMCVLASVVITANLRAGASPPATQPTPIGVMIGPITPLTISAAADLACRGLRANLLAEMLRRIDLQAITTEVAEEQATNLPLVAAQGKSAGAQFVICGSCEQSVDQLRFLGAILNCDNGRAVASLKITGSAADLFDLEDRFTEQALRALPHQPAARTASHPKRLQANTGPLVDFTRPRPSPWDHHFVDADAEDSMNNLRYGNLDALSGYGWGYGYGGYGGGFGYGGFFPSANYNYVGYGSAWGSGFPLPGSRAINQP